ncbi:MAG: InlB B-repeat-containing protein [Clostridia bacterium]|nr:InlB B-repeat-containing protein [Clostridia bacterium]
MKKVVSVLLVLVMILSVSPLSGDMFKAGGIDSLFGITASAANLTLTELKAKYPQGKYWNHVGSSSNNPNGWTNTPCPSHSSTSTCNGFVYGGTTIGWQCFGFALQLGYDAYGSNPKNWGRAYNLDNIKPGDIINYDGNNPGHTVFVIGVNGDTVSFAECNWGSRCIISWTRSLKKSQFNNLYNVYVAPYALTTDDPPVSHTINSNYSKNFTAYPKAKITAANIFDANHNQIDSTSWIGTSDKCTIHEVYTDGCCKVTYPLDAGGTKTVYSKISLFNVTVNECTGYNIAYSYNTENYKFYDSNTVEFTITPHVNNRDAYDNEITNISLYFKKPNGEVNYIPLGKNKSVEFYMPDYDAGKYIFWAKVETIYGSSEGAEDDGSLSLDLARLSWSNFRFESDVIYARIKFKEIDRYLTVNADENAVSWERKNSTSSDQSQIWKVIRNSDGTFTIQSVQNNKVLDISKGSYCRGANVLTYTSQDSENQKWYLSKDSNNNSFIRAAKSNSAVLDVEGHSAENGTNVGLWTYHGGDAQKVVFQYPYLIQYNANGGSNPPSSQDKEYGKTLALSTTVPTRTGYTFLGWSTSSSATSASYSAGGSYSANADAILYAVWKANTYTVKYNSNGGSGTMSNSSHTYNVSKALSSNAFIRNGYTFLGWSTSSSATSPTYTNGQSVKNLTSTNGGTVNLYAVWKNNDTALSVNSANSAVISTGGEKKYYTFTPTESGTYVIYSTGSSDTKVYLYNSSGSEITSNDDGGEDRNFRLQYNLTAGTKYRIGVGYYNSSATGTIPFKFGKVYTVTYNANGGSGAPSSQSKDYGASLTLSSATPTRAGYTFLGWSTNSSATSASYSAGDSYTANADTTLYAVWKAVPKETYTVTYNANGGSVTPSSASVTEGSSTILPTPTKYYTLSFNANGGSGAPSSQSVSVSCKGWSASSSSSTATYSCGGSYKPTSNSTLYAVWNSSATKTLPSSVPARSGYTFVGWASSSLATTATWNPGDVITVTGNTTIYAVWRKNESPTPPPAPTVEYKSVYLDYKSTYSINVEGFEATDYIVEDDSILSVDSNGKVTAKRPGTSDIYVYDANSDVRVVYTFSVDYAWWQWIIIIVLFGWIWY